MLSCSTWLDGKVKSVGNALSSNNGTKQMLHTTLCFPPFPQLAVSPNPLFPVQSWQVTARSQTSSSYQRKPMDACLYVLRDTPLGSFRRSSINPFPSAPTSDTLLLADKVGSNRYRTRTGKTPQKKRE